MQWGEFFNCFFECCLVCLKFMDYVIGQNCGNMFCYWFELGMCNWVGIVGLMVWKFGIYFGKVGEDCYECFCYI